MLVDAYLVEPPPSEFDELAALAGLTREELRDYLEREVERRRAELPPGVDVPADTAETDI